MKTEVAEVTIGRRDEFFVLLKVECMERSEGWGILFVGVVDVDMTKNSARLTNNGFV